ncbi:MAG: 50S ribosomal protein L21 [Candidatus Gracilibacteria bacterium]|nr:50S ribosomal protein L21 [Candidatus Gracilibacteria bacterium]
MLAVIELGGNQFIVRVGDVIDVKKLDKQVGENIEVTAMLVSDEEGNNVKVGTPLVEGSKIELKVLDQYKGEKIRVFKMKSKKRYARNRGFRPHLTKLEILNIA